MQEVTSPTGHFLRVRGAGRPKRLRQYCFAFSEAKPVSLGTSWYSKLAQLQFLHMAPTVESFLQVFKAPQQPPAAFGFLFPGPPNLDGHCVLSHAIPRRPRRPASRLQPVTGKVRASRQQLVATTWPRKLRKPF